MKDVYILKFGKHDGERIHEVPKQYLEWLANREPKMGDNPAFVEAIDYARKEIKRRGIIPDHEIELSPHSINRFYQRYGKNRKGKIALRRQDLLSKGGIYSYLLDFATKAYKQKRPGTDTVSYKGFKFHFEEGKYRPILKTIV